MLRKTEKKKVYDTGKSKINEELIHLHMSNHYRRILNAKKAVDNSPPYCYKIKTNKPVVTKTKVNQPYENLPLTDRSISTNSNKESCWGVESYSGSSRYHARCVPDPPFRPKIKINYSGMALVDRITYDTKNGPAAYCEGDWMGEKPSHQECVFSAKQADTASKTSPNAKRRLPNASSNESAKTRKFAAQNKTECPANAEAPNCKCTKICVCDANEAALKKNPFNPKEQSLTSSRDSAYNGGVSSLPESRSPTPDHRRKKECCCCCCEKKQRDGKPFESAKSTGSSVASPRPPLPSMPHPPPSTPQPSSDAVIPSPKSKNKEQESFEKLQEDSLYVKFIQDITTEILDKNLYTNKALKKVMKKHIKSNIKRLHKDRMLKEVENLRIQLGIPEDKTLLDLEADGEEASKHYPVISDSEFTMPKKAAEGSSKVSPGTRSPEKMPKSISDVIAACRESEHVVSGSETDNGEVISVIQVMKTVRERRKEKSVEKVIAVQNSSDDSDRPSDPKKRSVLQSRKQKHARTYTSSSSDSERSGNCSMNIREAAECEASSSKETYLGEYAQKSTFLAKKNRSVSFWKSPDLSLGRTIEMSHKRASADQRISPSGWSKTQT